MNVSEYTQIKNESLPNVVGVLRNTSLTPFTVTGTPNLGSLWIVQFVTVVYTVKATGGKATEHSQWKFGVKLLENESVLLDEGITETYTIVKEVEEEVPFRFSFNFPQPLVIYPSQVLSIEAYAERLNGNGAQTTSNGKITVGYTLVTRN